MTESGFTGNWDKAISDLDHLGTNVLNAVKLTTHQNALILQATITKHFQNQDLGWAALKKGYPEWKAAHGLSNQILIATSTLMQSITTNIVDGGMTAFVGVLRQSSRKDGADPISIAAVHEFGSEARSIKKRPYLIPSLKEDQPKMKERYVKAITDILSEVG